MQPGIDWRSQTQTWPFRQAEGETARLKMVTTSTITRQLQSVRDRGVAYLVGQQREDGAVGQPEKDGLGPYYKTIWAFAAGGQPEGGNRLATWVRDNVQAEAGDFTGPMRGTLHDSNYAYPNAWLLIGAQKLGRFDIFTRGMRFLATLQHAETGGFRMQRGRDDAIQDVLDASQAGNALLLDGRIGDALRVGAFLRMIWDAQPHPNRELFFVYKPGAGLRTEFPPERQRLHSIRIDATRQMYFNIGIAAAFLSRLTMATGDASWVELGKRYLEIGFHVLDEMYETAQVGKVGWGAALTFGITGEERYRGLAERVGRAMMTQQTEGGGWDNTGGYVNDAIRIEVTAEFVVLLDEMIGGLSMR
jgi:hypothetical protein